MSANTIERTAIWYWNVFVKANSIYLDGEPLGPNNYEKKNKLLEIMNGALIGFIEENFKDPSPLPASAIIKHQTEGDNDEILAMQG